MGEGKFCTKCGAANKADARYCMKCGHRLSGEEGGSKLPKKRKRHLFDASRESAHARGYAIAVVMGIIFCSAAQNISNDPATRIADAFAVESAHEALGQAQVWFIIGIIITIGGILGLVQYFANREK